MNAYPHDVDIDLDDIFEISVGPRDMNDGIKSCLTYNPPGESTPGYQRTRGVSAFNRLMYNELPKNTTNSFMFSFHQVTSWGKHHVYYERQK